MQDTPLFAITFIILRAPVGERERERKREREREREKERKRERKREREREKERKRERKRESCWAFVLDMYSSIVFHAQYQCLDIMQTADDAHTEQQIQHLHAQVLG